MPGYYLLKYPDATADTEFYGIRGIYYELPDGSHVDVSSRPCWCVECGCVTNGEWIEPIGELEQQLAELYDPNSERYQYHEKCEVIMQNYKVRRQSFRFRESAVQKAIERLEWRRLRTSAPKCLLCGGTAIYFPADPDGRVEIDGKVVVWIENCGMCSTDFMEWYFTVEGNRIPRETQPKYWGLRNDEAE